MRTVPLSRSREHARQTPTERSLGRSVISMNDYDVFVIREVLRMRTYSIYIATNNEHYAPCNKNDKGNHVQSIKSGQFEFPV